MSLIGLSSTFCPDFTSIRLVFSALGNFTKLKAFKNYSIDL